MTTETSVTPWLRRGIVVALLSGLLVAGFVVVRPFLAAIAWAAILVYAAWPLHVRAQRWLRGSRAWSALVMSVALTLVSGVSLLWFGALLRNEALSAAREAAAMLQAGVRLPEPIVRLPWLGPWLQERLLELGTDRTAWGRQVGEWAEQWGVDVMRIVGDVGRNAFRFAVALLTSYFLFRDGDRLLEQLRGSLRGLLGERVQAYFAAMGDTTRAVVYGLLFAALAQGLMAGFGYWVAGVRAPVFWGAATAVIALVPFGAPLIWGPIALWLLLQGAVVAGVGLLAWGILVVSWVDNLVRPLVISGMSHVPFLLVLFGVLGGLAAFGLIGLFVGPVILAILLALWREWTADSAAEGAR